MYGNWSKFPIFLKLWIKKCMVIHAYGNVYESIKIDAQKTKQKCSLAPICIRSWRICFSNRINMHTYLLYLLILNGDTSRALTEFWSQDYKDVVEHTLKKIYANFHYELFSSPFYPQYESLYEKFRTIFYIFAKRQM